MSSISTKRPLPRLVLRLLPFARFSRDRAGATAVEFGLLAVPFLALICAIFEIGFIEFDSELLQAGINSAARQMLTGQVQSANVTTATQFVSTYLCPSTGPKKLPNNFDCSKVIVDARPSTSFTSADLTSAIYKGQTKFCPGGPNQITVLRVIYPLPAMLPVSLWNTNLGVVTDVPGQAGRFHILMGEAVFQTENFAASYTPPTGC